LRFIQGGQSEKSYSCYTIKSKFSCIL